MVLPVRNVRSKYGAVKTQVDGITFASKREAARYVQLKQLEKSGYISDLSLQPSFEIIPSMVMDGKKQRAIKYIADFKYVDHLGNGVIEDVKGMKTREYQLKRRLMKLMHGIEVKEVR
jgi:ribosomal protein S8